jgi:hypothetical protein
MTIDGPYVNNIEGPYNVRLERERPYSQRMNSEAAVADRDPGSIGNQADELSIAIEELAHQISRLRERLDPICCPHPERAETMPCAPSGSPLGQRLAEFNSGLRVQIMRLAVITDNLGL